MQCLCSLKKKIEKKPLTTKKERKIIIGQQNHQSYFEILSLKHQY